MTIDRSRIRVKAMLIAPNEDRTAHAVSLNAASIENPHGYHRLIGGGVELGETHAQAIRREVDEELGAQIHDLALVTVLENIFRLNGEVGHEIVFVYAGRLDPLPAAVGATLLESDGTVVPVEWRPATGADPAMPLYPNGLEQWVQAVCR